MYLPLIGYALFAASLVSGVLPARAWAPGAAMLMVMALLAGTRTWDQHHLDFRGVESERVRIRQGITALEALRPCAPRGGHVLFLEDPWPADDWQLHMITRLVCRDAELSVHRAKQPVTIPREFTRKDYDHVLMYREGRFAPAAPGYWPLTSPLSREARGLVWPAYLLPGLRRYGMDEGVDSCSKVNEQMRMPG
jgi:hypothetical protein